MNFLFVNPISALGNWLSGTVSDAVQNAIGTVEGLIVRGIRELFFLIDTLIYDLIIKLYNVFHTLCTVRLLDGSLMDDIASRVGMLLGLIMIFYVTLSFIKMLVDPDSISNKDTGAAAIIKKILIVIVMLGVSRFAFETLFMIQKTVISSNAISKVFLPVIPTNSDGSDFENFGGLLAEETLHAFYYIDDFDMSNVSDSETLETVNECRNILNSFRKDIISNPASFSLGNICLNSVINVKVSENSDDTTEDFVINYNFLLATLAGVGIAYFLFMYCIQVGIRMVQLMVLEIISPMAFISYISPRKDTMFSKWIKIYFSTYIDAFIRVAIINLVTMVISALFTTGNGFDGFAFWKDFDDVNFATKSFYTIIMILALLAFAKKAPELIKEFLPKSASGLKLFESPKDLLKNELHPIAAPIGLLAKKTVGGFDSLTHGHGFHDGWKRQKGAFGGWLDKQRESLTPYAYQEHKKSVDTRREGQEEVVAIDEKWEAGAQVAQILKKYVDKKYGAGTKKWTEAFDSTAVSDGTSTDEDKYRSETIDAYKQIYHNEAFINSKVHLDYTKSVKEKLEHDIDVKRSNGTLTDADLEAFEKSVKTLEGAQAVHDSMRKQYHNSDAKVEDQFKFIKGNEVNPANPSSSRTGRGIGL